MLLTGHLFLSVYYTVGFFRSMQDIHTPLAQGGRGLTPRGEGGGLLFAPVSFSARNGGYIKCTREYNMHTWINILKKFSGFCCRTCGNRFMIPLPKYLREEGGRGEVMGVGRKVERERIGWRFFCRSRISQILFTRWLRIIVPPPLPHILKTVMGWHLVVRDCSTLWRFLVHPVCM